MYAVKLETIIRRLPPGRARTRYQRLAGLIGEGITLSVPYCDQPLWLVPSVDASAVLVSVGVPRWRIWTLAELQALLGAFGTSLHSLDQAAEALRSNPR